jgi:hypothetical protein
MKKTLLMAGALLALTVGVASAQSGLNLSWNDCGASGAAAKTFACNSNTGGNLLVGSMIIGADMPALNGHEGVFDLQTNQAALSNWWKIGATPNCRAGNTITYDYNFTSSVNCLDPWGNAGLGSGNYSQAWENVANRARIRTVYGINPPVAAPGDAEIYVVKVNINNSRTAGPAGCAGCTDGACIVFNSSKMTQPNPNPAYTVSGPIVRDFVTWQSGGGLGGQCPGVTPTKSAT